jgi:dTMP kinase
MLITLEGIEGSGKTTQIDHMAACLAGWGYATVVTREPGGTTIGRQIRRVLLDPGNAGLDGAAEMLLYTADRRQHIQEVIAPALAGGKIVICDRYFDATYVYQGVARGVDMSLLRQLHGMVNGDLMPDITFLLDLDPEVGLARAWGQVREGGRSNRETRFEKEALAFHRKVRDGYLDLAHSEPSRFVIIDATGPPETVRQQIAKTLEKHFATHC